MSKPCISIAAESVRWATVHRHKGRPLFHFCALPRYPSLQPYGPYGFYEFHETWARHFPRSPTTSSCRTRGE